MKRLFIFIVIVLVLGVAASYLLIPGEIRISESLVMGAPMRASTRLLQEHRNWEKWWPAKNEQEDSLYYRKFTFYPGKKANNTYQVFIQNDRHTLSSSLQLLPMGDSTETVWETSMKMGTDPLTRIRNYLHARAVRTSLNELSLSLKNYLEHPENIYGFKIERTKLPSRHLVAINASFNHYPKAAEIYTHINQIKSYIDTTDAEIAGDPLLNVSELSNNQYKALIAIPVDREIPVQGKMLNKRIVTGGALTTKVKGGTATTRQALSSLYSYLHDYDLALSSESPLESLLTDRTSEADTSRWETAIYLFVN